VSAPVPWWWPSPALAAACPVAAAISPARGLRPGPSSQPGCPASCSPRWPSLARSRAGTGAPLIGLGPGLAILAVRLVNTPRPGYGRPGRQRGVRRVRRDPRLTVGGANILIQAGQPADLVLFSGQDAVNSTIKTGPTLPVRCDQPGPFRHLATAHARRCPQKVCRPMIFRSLTSGRTAATDQADPGKDLVSGHRLLPPWLAASVWRPEAGERRISRRSGTGVSWAALAVPAAGLSLGP
jgi:hypothetical protein